MYDNINVYNYITLNNKQINANFKKQFLRINQLELISKLISNNKFYFYSSLLLLYCLSQLNQNKIV